MKLSSYKGILFATIGAFIVSSIWYILFGNVLTAGEGNTATAQGSPAATVLVELSRNLVLSSVLAYLLAELSIKTVTQALRLSGLLWVGFPVILLVGSVFHEGVPWMVAVIHSGD